MQRAAGCHAAQCHARLTERNTAVHTSRTLKLLFFRRKMFVELFKIFRVCPALCEAACTCNLTGEPVATKENEYAIIENAYEKGYFGLTSVETLRSYSKNPVGFPMIFSSLHSFHPSKILCLVKSFYLSLLRTETLLLHLNDQLQHTLIIMWNDLLELRQIFSEMI